MAWKVEFSEKAQKDLDKLDRVVVQRILSFLHQRVGLRNNPRELGQSLAGSKLGTLWKYRVGDYRIIANIEDDRVRVLVVSVGHRREVYR